SLAISPGAVYTHNFTTPLNISTPGIYTLKVWARNPNSSGAGITNNDTLTRVIKACYPLNGTYTIDAGGAGATNYATFADAMSDLNICGVHGAVVFNVASGTFTEQVVIPPISGASAINTITFNGVGAGGTILTYGNQ